jgi:hypothetical protein
MIVPCPVAKRFQGQQAELGVALRSD